MFNREKVAELQVEILGLKVLLESKNDLIRRAGKRFASIDDNRFSASYASSLSICLDRLEQEEKEKRTFERLRDDVAKIVQPTCIRKTKVESDAK